MAGTPTQIQLRRDTAANLALVNPVLASGEVAIDTTNKQLRIGDGITPWSALPGFVGIDTTGKHTLLDGSLDLNPDPYITMNGGSGYRQIRKDIAAVLAGGRKRWLFPGDSTTVGAGCGTGTNGLVGARSKNYVTKLAAALTALGIPTYNEAVFGDQNTFTGSAVAYTSYDPRWVIAGGFAVNAVATLGQNAWRSTSTGASISFTPGISFDTFDVYYIVSGGQGSFNVNVDGGANIGGATSTAGTAATGKATFSCAAGTHTINLVTVDTSVVSIIGIVPYLSTAAGIDLIQVGNYGGTIGGFISATQPWNPTNQSLLGKIGHSITHMQLTINDANSATAIATYAAGLATFEAAHVTAGAKVQWQTGIVSGTTQSTDGTLAAIVAAVAAQASANSDLFLRFGERLGTYAQVNADGWMYDTKHGTANLYADEARWLAKALTAPL
jgi:hypothetical protein